MLSWNTTALPFNYGGFVYGSEMPTRGYFEQYWREYFACIYSDEAREYTAYFYLRPDDIRRLAFNRPITVQGHRYRLTKVENYQAGADAVTKCTFLRDIQDLNFGECDAVLQPKLGWHHDVDTGRVDDKRPWILLLRGPRILLRQHNQRVRVD